MCDPSPRTTDFAMWLASPRPIRGLKEKSTMAFTGLQLCASLPAHSEHHPLHPLALTR